MLHSIETSVILREIDQQGYKLRDGRVATELTWAEDDVRGSLLEIQRRVTKLLADLDGEMPSWAIRQIADCAGSTGPIGSQWERAIAKAVKVQTIIDHCMVSVEDEN